MASFGKYELHETLGEGAFGKVYRATDTSLDRVIALKILHPQLAREPNFIDRFRREARIGAQLDHPGIVPIYETGEIEGRFFIAMKYLPGGSLKARLAGGPLQLETAVRILLQVCAALQTAHARGLVHRDLKPANLLFDAAGQVVIVDFGLARAFTVSDSSSSVAGVVGTPFYRAPELWRGDDPGGPAADVYALGCILVEMLTGITPFHGNTPEQVMTRHLLDGPDFGPVWPPLASPVGLEMLVVQALEKVPSQRIPDATVFAKLLCALISTPGMIDNTSHVLEDGHVKNAYLPTTKSRWKLFFCRSLFIIGAGLIGLLGIFLMSNGEKKLEEIQALGVSSPISPTSNAVDTPVLPAGTPSISATMTLTVTPSLTPIPSLTLTAMPSLLPPPGMVLIPAGSFKMGNNQGDGDEKPSHNVILDAFWIDKYEVTNTNYAKCEIAGKCPSIIALASSTRKDYYKNGQYANYPMINVSWYEAQTYCKWRGTRLPTEAEWEKAARGGLDNMLFPWGDAVPVCTSGASSGAQFGSCGVKDTILVGNFAPNGYGLFDMAGNVSEWVADWYDQGSYTLSSDINPTGPTEGTLKAARGGSWLNIFGDLRVSNRVDYGYPPSSRYQSLGFRCAASLPNQN